MERSAIRDRLTPDYAALHPGYKATPMQVRHYVDGALRAATSIPPVSQFTRTSKPVPRRDSTIVPPHDMPVAKKLMVERAGRSLQVRGNSAWKATSPGICKTRPVDPERIMRPGASICALT